MYPVVKFEKVTKIEKGKTILNDLSFEIEKGGVTALVGPNGAGKTTLLSILLGIRRPTRGNVTVAGRPPGHPEARAKIGAVFQEAPFIDYIKVREMIDLWRAFYRKPLTADALIEMAGLSDVADQYARRLSGGQKRRLEFALAMAGDPDILILDEPTNGMDDAAKTRFWEIVCRLGRSGRTVLFTAHSAEEAARWATRLIVLNAGRLVAVGEPSA